MNNAFLMCLCFDGQRGENKKHVTALERQKERAEPAMLPSRAAQLLTLHSTREFDVLVVGGGATGSGCALDAVTRGKSCAGPSTTILDYVCITSNNGSAMLPVSSVC